MNSVDWYQNWKLAKMKFMTIYLICIGKDLIKSEKYLHSVEVYAEALNIKPLNKFIQLDLLYDRAFASSKIGNFRDAVEDCTEALSIDPVNTAIRLLRAECNSYLMEYEACIIDYEVVLNTTEIRRNPERANDVNSKLEIAKMELQRKLAEQKNTQANKFFCVKFYRLADCLYSEAIEMWPENIIYYKNRCNCLIMLEDFRRAMDDSRRMILLDKTFAHGYDRFIKCCLVLGYYDEAEQANKTLREIETIMLNTQYTDLCKKLRKYEKLANQSYENKQFLSASNAKKDAH